MGNCFSGLNKEKIYEDKREKKVSGAVSAIVVGVTGRGKSSVANALVQRTIISDKQNYFPVGAGGVRVTDKAAIGAGCGWQVVDTVGSSDGYGDGTKEGSIQHIKDFIEQVCKIRISFNYIIFVAKGDGLEASDETAWSMFREIFRGCKNNLVIVFTSTTQRWVDDNIDELKRAFYPCKLFVGVSLPGVSANAYSDEYTDVRIQRDERIRTESINHLCNVLMNNLINVGTCTPNMYKYSQKERVELASCALEVGEDTIKSMGWGQSESRILNLGRDVEVFASNAVHAIVSYLF
ncbi:hypothetical protein K7432_017497 [Basidiobolus ranarum]|uniref:AIG1-type G domain-containing protein n=1 Tax=Basidiobolus ranarum TaxID=34480 RepID=A0ABR2VLB9_9FUNG